MGAPLKPQQSSGTSTQCGFTLVEIMTISAIFGIISMVAMPVYTNWNTSYQLRQATEELAANLKLARTAAISRGKDVEVTLVSPEGKVKSIERESSSFLFEKAVRVTPGTVGFNKFGLRSGGGAGNQLIQLVSSNGTVYSVVVTNSGIINWCTNPSCP